MNDDLRFLLAVIVVAVLLTSVFIGWQLWRIGGFGWMTYPSPLPRGLFRTDAEYNEYFRDWVANMPGNRHRKKLLRPDAETPLNPVPGGSPGTTGGSPVLPTKGTP